MSDRINIFKEASNLHTSPQFSSYSKVIIHIDDETDITVGNDYGRTLEVTNPFGTQQMAEDMLAKLSGFQYQPYDASGALLDPAAEIGDAISIKNIYGGLYTRDRTFSRLMKAEISAPYDEEINHEYQFATPQERKVKREFGNVKATLAIQADRITAEVTERTAQGQQIESQLNIQATEIAAKVSQTGGSNSSFGWSLTSNGHTWYAGSQEVMKVTASGLEVKGKVTATSGYIGNGTSGFTISNTAIYNNISVFDGTQNSGIYLGTNGIQLGQGFKVNSAGSLTATRGLIGGFTITGTTFHNWDSSTNTGIWMKAANSGVVFQIGNNFKVDAQGNLTANSGNFLGSVRASSIQYGGENGTFSGDGLSNYSISSLKYGSESVLNSAIGGGAVSYSKTSFTGTLDQVGINESNIEAIETMFATTLYSNDISTRSLSVSDDFTCFRNNVGITVINGHGCLTIY